ncbi:serine/threonine-protein kinase [Nocardia sp. NPDC059240]|uniref:serine/threonine-protein kinase n=1 Tax=Nocardia sp. NPDC059240 TaxID=3346786 RepID=UPI00368D5A8D
MELRPGTYFAGYVIERLIGTGGMGAVYLAGHPRLERRVALKVISAVFAGNHGARAAFEREATLAARLEHPNIVAVYDRNDPGDDALWLSMRFIAGGDATGLLAARPHGLEPQRAIQLITDAAEALDYAHSRNVLHRDVKPANLLIEHDPRRGERAILTDFGIARSFDDTLTVSRITATFAYAAPERFANDPTDHRADIYSLGCTLHQLLTGQPPFPRKDQAAMIAAHLLDPPPSPRSIRPHLPAALDQVIATAMAKYPGDRYQSCADLAAAAMAAMSGTAQPPPASTTVVHRPSPPKPSGLPLYQPPTRSAAHIVPWIAILAVAVAIIAVIAWAPWHHQSTATLPPPTSTSIPAQPSTQPASTTPPPTTTVADVPGLTPFVGSWHAHGSGLEIDPNGSGSLTYADLSACPTACSYGAAPSATVRFTVTSVSNGLAAGTVTASTDIENDKIGEQVRITLGSGLQGKGVVLTVTMGKMNEFPFCNETSTNYCGS